MAKKITTIGFEIPGKSDFYIDFDDQVSLMDADIILVSPDSLRPWGDWVSFTSTDGGCYNVEASRKYTRKIAHLKKELGDFLRAGKNVFIFLTGEKTESLSSGVSSKRKGESTYNTFSVSNYGFLPIDIGILTSASGRHVAFSGKSIFSNFYTKFKEYLEYESYVENPTNAEIVFTGKDTSKVLGAIYKAGNGHLITLPKLRYNEEEFIEVKEDEDGKEKKFWNEAGLDFGNAFAGCLYEIDKSISSESERTPAPEWLSDKQFEGTKEASINTTINKNNLKIEKIVSQNEKLKLELEEEAILKGLLFEQGKPLEEAVIKALSILGYKAENYDDGELEMDQVIVSPEKHRYIGETEGKDTKDINITKFRQLVDALNADFARDEVSEKAFGILFGNAERLIEPAARKLDFTAKCLSGAEREKIALVKTLDLFFVAKYLNENDDAKFMKKCRDAIHNSLGGMVKFPNVPIK